MLLFSTVKFSCDGVSADTKQANNTNTTRTNQVYSAWTQTVLQHLWWSRNQLSQSLQLSQILRLFSEERTT